MVHFTGRYTVSVDDKGRIAIPAKMRSAAAALGSEKFHVRSGFDGCLDLLSESEYNSISEKMSTDKPLDDEKQRFLKRFMYPNSGEGVPDGQGRIAIPKHLLEFAGITDKCLVIGVGDKIEVWNEERFDSYQRSFKMTPEQVVEFLYGTGKGS